MATTGLIAAAILMASSTLVRAEEPAMTASAPVLTLDPYATTSATAPAADPPIPRLAPYVEYGGDMWHRRALTGDWGGTRQQLMEKGVRLDASYTQIFQRNVAGATSQACTYRGGLDITLQLDTTYMGLWPGGLFKMKAEGGWGQGDNARIGGLMPVDTNGLYPVPGEDAFVVAELNYTQFLAPFMGVTLGKYQPRDANVFAHDETEQFLNAAFNFNPAIGTTVPTTFLGGGVILLPTEWLVSATMVLDTEGNASSGNFDTVFRGGTTVMQSFDATVKPFDLTGHQRFSFFWTDKVRTQLEQSPRDIIGAILPGGPVSGLRSASGDWAFTYDFDQYVYVVPGTKDRGIGVFGRYGLTNGVVNPVSGFYSIGVGGKGLVPTRENDTFGVGYYFLSLSRELPTVVRQGLRDEQGVELFYNIAVTPWCKITPDLQIISPARESVDTTVVVGLRMKIDF